MQKNYEKVVEYFCVFSFKSWMIFGEVLCLAFFFYLLFCFGSKGKALCVIYMIYLATDHRRAFQAYTLKRESSCSLFWRSLKNYFPTEIIKTSELAPNKNYLIAGFPHGILAFSAFANFTTCNNEEFSRLFPNVNVSFCSLNYHFWIPVFRDIYLSWGMRSVTKKAILNILTKNNLKDGETSSNAALILVGGYKEMRTANPNEHKIYLKSRKGFIKIAMQTGSSLVPAYTFGENDLFNPITPKENPILWKLRKLLPFSQNFMPKKCRLMTVVGKPIEVEKMEDPNEMEVDKLHMKFCAEIRELFEENKLKYYGSDAENMKLEIL